MMESFKKSLTQHAIAIGLFLLVALLYSYPVLQGNKLAAGDTIHWMAMSQEARAWYEKTGENPLWSNSMFGGMPTFTTYTQGKTNLVYIIQDVLMNVIPNPAFFFFIAMLCFYILAQAWKLNKWVSIIGAIAFAFASYNLQIIVAGHNTKMISIALMPLVVAGMHWVYQGRFLLGAGVSLLGLSLLISNGMYQIDYYLMIILAGFGIGYFIEALQSNKLKEFFISSGIMLGVAVLSIGPSIDLFLSNKEYAKYTMRGGQSELTLDKKEVKKKGGLDKDYAFAWSQSIGETFTILVPNLYGGGSQTNAGNSSKTYEAALGLGIGEESAEQFASQIPSYWGAQPFLSGPNYFGIIIVLLFVIGMFIIKSRLKWILLVLSCLGIIMSWGKHFSALNYFLFDHLPFFNNFRTPSMIMVIPAFMFCITAVWALHIIFKEELEAKVVLDYLKKSVLLVGGLTLIMGIGGSMFLSFKSDKDAQLKERMVQMVGNEQAGTQLYQAIVEDRPSLAMKDGIRSIIFILLAAALLWMFAQKKLSQKMALLGMGLLITVDLLGIGTRYLDAENYMSKDDFDAQFTPRPVDQQLKQDPDPYYRIFDLTQDPYNEAMQAYHNKCVGGYHPAKLETYQDLIDQHLSGGKMNEQVLSMLNTKYILFNGPDKKPAIQPNMQACGNAWFVPNIQLVENANEEMLALKAKNISDTANVPNAFVAKQTAVIQKKYWKQTNANFVVDSASKIILTKYGLNNLQFSSDNGQDGFAVFADVYYPAGWKATIDGKEAEIIKTNYLLRGLFVPAGKHQIEFTFKPDTYYKWNKVSLISSILILLLVVAGIGLSVKQEWQKQD
jgi:hypothetical protein